MMSCSRYRIQDLAQHEKEVIVAGIIRVPDRIYCKESLRMTFDFQNKDLLHKDKVFLIVCFIEKDRKTRKIQTKQWLKSLRKYTE